MTSESPSLPLSLAMEILCAGLGACLGIWFHRKVIRPWLARCDAWMARKLGINQRRSK